jgi:hypothetical protein
MRIRPSHPPGDQLTADLVAVHRGQVTVEDDHVVASRDRTVECLLPVERDVDGHALAAQADGDGLGELHLVLGYQHSHLQDARPAVTAWSQDL